ncbi:MAG: 6-phosphogluconolactonase [Candidatus Sungbacteria bacterium]|nr:6-phosphogluconolactonase [Candidatus Sungbacteria bacterium]
MEIIRCQNNMDALRRAGNVINLSFESCEPSPALFLVSGGSAFHLLKGINIGHFGARITISVLDERYSPDISASNFLSLQSSSFYLQAQQAGAVFLHPWGGKTNDVIAEEWRQGKVLEGLQESVRSYESELRAWKEAHPDGKIFATQGIGNDGHTAGILPYPENPALFHKIFEDGEKWVAGYDTTPQKSLTPLRITLRLPFLRNEIHQSIVYVAGEDKRIALERVLQDSGSLAETPARILREMKDARIFTDIA